MTTIGDHVRANAGPWFKQGSSHTTKACLILTCSDSSPTARIDAWRWPHEAGAARSLDPAAHQAVVRARQAATQLVPPLPGVAPLNFAAQTSLQWITSNQVGQPTDLIRGPSLGLAVALATVAQQANLKLPGDFVAIADVDENGQCVQAEVNAKLALLDKIPGAVCRVLVAPGSTVDRAQLGALECCEVPDVSAAVTLLLGEDWRTQALQELDLGRTARFFLTQLSRSAGQLMASWVAVVQFASAAMTACPDDADRTRRIWRLIRVVAERHAGHSKATLRLSQVLYDWPAENDNQRSKFEAELLQDVTDYGTADLPEVDSDWSIDRIKLEGQAALAGATARYLAVTNCDTPDGALTCFAACRLWFEAQHQLKDSSYSLCGSLRLAAASRHPSLTALLALADEFLLYYPAPDDSLYVREAYVAALALSGHDATEGTRRLRETLEMMGKQALHLRFGLLRHGQSLARQLRRADSEWELRETLEREAPSSPIGPWFKTLADLDRALDAGNDSEAIEALKRLIALEPQALWALIKDKDLNDLKTARSVARFYPY